MNQRYHFIGNGSKVYNEMRNVYKQCLFINVCKLTTFIYKQSIHLSQSEPIRDFSVPASGSGMGMLTTSGQWNMRGFLRTSGKVCKIEGIIFEVIILFTLLFCVRKPITQR